MNQSTHADGGVSHGGTPLLEARLAVVLLHGRGGSAEDILGLAAAIDLPGIAFLSPQAKDRTWYPYSFLEPRQRNEPFLSSALARVEDVVKMAEAAGIERERIAIAGFSQGACLATEFVATHPARYGGLIALTGGLIGLPGTGALSASRLDNNTLAGTPVFLGSGDPDPHVPWARVEESAKVLQSMGAHVSVKRYPGRSHTVSQDEILEARALLRTALA